MKRPAELQYAWRGWILALLFAVLAWARFRSGAELAPAWLALVAAGAGYRLFAGRYIAGHSNSVRLSGDALALEGPYRVGRHPLYLSNLITAAGLILFANCLPLWGTALLSVAVWGHHVLLARTEERFLAATQGKAYGEYLRASRRWVGIPRRGKAGLETAGTPAAGDMGALPTPSGIRLAWKRQAANLAKTAACILVLWALAGLRP